MINENIKRARENAGISQRELGRRIKKTGQYISYLEKSPAANPSVDVLNDIANALDIDVSQLLGNKDDQIISAVAEAMLNCPLFPDIDYSKSNFIGSVIDNDHLFDSLSKLLRDVIKLIMYVEDIEPENIKAVDLDELRGLIIEFLTRKDKIFKLTGNTWDAYNKKFPINQLLLTAENVGVDNLDESDKNKILEYYSGKNTSLIPDSVKSLFE